MIKNKKRKRIITIFIIIAICGLFILMQINTDGLMQEIEEAYRSKDYYVPEELYYDNPERYSNPNINYVLYSNDDILEEEYYDINRTFNRKSNMDDIENFSVNLELKRILAVHNFFDGYIWIGYKVEYLDANGSHISVEATSFPLKMKIHKVKGEWKVESMGLTV